MTRRLVVVIVSVAAVFAVPSTAAAHDEYVFERPGVWGVPGGRRVELNQTAGSDGHYVVAIEWGKPLWVCPEDMYCGDMWVQPPMTCTWSDGSVDDCAAVMVWFDEQISWPFVPNYNWYKPDTWVVPATCTWEPVPAPWGTTYEQTCPVLGSWQEWWEGDWVTRIDSLLAAYYGYF